MRKVVLSALCVVLLSAVFLAADSFSSHSIFGLVIFPRTYYACSQANGTTCGSTDTNNGWHSNATVSTTIADTNDCRTLATPCRSLDGIKAKINPAILLATVTVYVADAADTGTNCQSPSNSIWTVYGFGISPITKSSRLDNYPSAYLKIYGNPATQANAPISQTCGSSTRGANNALTFDGSGAVEINGFQIRGYGFAAANDFDGLGGVIQASGGAHVYVENLSCLGDTADAGMGQTYCKAAVGPGSVIAEGLNQTVTGGMGNSLASYGGTVYTFDPADTATSPTTLTFTCATGLVCGSDYFVLGGGSNVFEDRLTWTDNGPGTWAHFGGNLNGNIQNIEVYGANGATDCNSNGAGKCINGVVAATITAGNYNFWNMDEGSFADSDCVTALQFTCTVNVQPTVVGIAKRGAKIRYSNSAGAAVSGFNPNFTLLSGGCVSTFTSTFVDYMQCAIDAPAIQNTVVLTADFTDASSTSLQAITGLSWTLPASIAQTDPFVCHLKYSQATVVSDSFGIGDSLAPTRLDAEGWMNTSTTAQTFGDLANLATTTATAIVTATPTVTTANGVILSGTIQQPSNTTVATVQIYVKQTTAGDLVKVLAGSSCHHGY